MKFNYIEKQYDIDFEGKEYTMVQRTPAAMAKIKALSENTEMTEYENNMQLLDVLFGDGAATELFPDNENTNLDKLAAFSTFALDIFMKEYKELKAERAAKELKPYTDTLKTIENVAKFEAKKK
ncbi:MAG: hypothetical protein IJ365_00140 [Clostridia bacterium]|nr:hypothetical protein [Clostridia bacterium]